jgi:hypothetical protein
MVTTRTIDNQYINVMVSTLLWCVIDEIEMG